MSQGFGQAHGKIILIGEHSVVYNHPAIALPLLSATVQCYIEEALEDRFESIMYTGLMNDAPNTLNPFKELLKSLKDSLNLPSLRLRVKTNFVPYGGLGFSAALASSITEAVYHYANKTLTEQERFDWTQFSERLAHSNPSGIDATLVASKHALIYQKNHPSKPLKINIPGYLIVGSSGIRGETKQAVNHISSTLHHRSTQAAIKQLAELTDNVLNYMQMNDIKRVGEAMTKAHDTLRQLGVSHIQLDTMVNVALKQGALGAKLTGGGLGGSVIALSDTREIAEDILKHWKSLTQIKGWILPLKEV